MNEIPQNVIEALAQARETGAYNMFDRRGVTELVSMINEDAGEWLTENKARYMDALNAMGEYISKPKPIVENKGAESLKDFDAPATMNLDADDSIHSESAQPAASVSKGTAGVKLSEVMATELQRIAIQGVVHDFPAWKDSPMRKTYVPAAQLKALEKRGLIAVSSKGVLERGAGDDNIHYTRYQLTDAGREYAIAQGWLAAPVVTSEPAAPAEAVSAFDTTGLDAAKRYMTQLYGVDVTFKYSHTYKDTGVEVWEVLEHVGNDEYASVGVIRSDYVEAQHATTHAATAGDGDSVKLVTDRLKASIQHLIDNAPTFEDLELELAGVLDFDLMMRLKATRRKELDAKDAEIERLKLEVKLMRKTLSYVEGLLEEEKRKNAAQ